MIKIEKAIRLIISNKDVETLNHICSIAQWALQRLRTTSNVAAGTLQHISDEEMKSLTDDVCGISYESIGEMNEFIIRINGASDIDYYDEDFDVEEEKDDHD